MDLIKTKAFVHTFSDIWKYSDRRMCFIIGSGASKSSGIRTNDELARQWLSEIEDRMEDDADAFAAFLKAKQIDLANPAANYTDIFNERFRYDLTVGAEYINKEIAAAKPSFGYAVLAQVLAEKHHSVVVSTNYDDLVEEAIYTYTNKRPIVLTQATQARGALAGGNRPLIFKLHRGYQKQAAHGIASWSDALNSILSSSILVFIGYDGNDTSGLMGSLEQLPSIENLFWCRQPNMPQSDRVRRFVDTHNGKLVDIEGFDELMQTVSSILHLPEISQYNETDIVETIEREESRIVEERTPVITEIVDQTIPIHEPVTAWNQEIATEATSAEETRGEHIETEKAEEKPAKEVGTPDNVVNNSIDPTSTQVTRNGHTPHLVRSVPETEAGKIEDWVLWEHKAKAAATPEERGATYKRALELLPESSELHINYAILLHEIIGDYNSAEVHYKKAINLNPENANYIGNYAAFLYEIRKDYEGAERLYKRCLDIEGNSANANANYAIFLKNIRKDYAGAEQRYKTALELSPDNTTYQVNYGIFLKDIKKEYDTAESYFRRALETEPDSANAYGNYALFLKDVKKDYTTAEQYYKQAVELEPDSAEYLGNYAGFLHYVKKDYSGAVKYYRKALELGPRNVVNIGNYANLLKHIDRDEGLSENIFKTSFEFGPMSGNYKGNHAQLLKNLSRDYAGAEKQYKKALEIDPNNAINNSNYAGFLKNVTKDYEQAEKYYKKALALEPDNPDFNCNYAIFLKDIRQDYYGAQSHYKKALEVDPDNANNNGNYAGFLYAIGRDKQAWAYLDTALRNCTDDTLLAELHFYQYAHVTSEREKSFQLLKLLLEKGIRSMGFNLQPNVEGAKQDGHPEPERLQVLADILTKDAPLSNLH